MEIGRFFAVLTIDLVVGAIFYTVATASAVERAERDRERILDALSKGPGADKYVTERLCTSMRTLREPSFRVASFLQLI